MTKQKQNIDYLLNPSTIAVIGASRNPASFSYSIVETALRCGYTGKFFLINPNADSILDHKCYPTIGDVEQEIDVALICVPKRIVNDALESAIDKGVKGVAIITSGFGEQGDFESKESLEKLVKKGKERGIRFLGPNILGFFSAKKSLDLIMTGSIKKGNSAFIAQSGNLTQSMTFPGAVRGLGFSYVVDIGNQVDLQAVDLIEYCKNDEETYSIGVHIEGLLDGRAFMKGLSESVKSKPILVFKSGRTTSGAQLVASHTASIAGDDTIYQEAFRQAGAIQVESFSEFVSTLMAFNQRKKKVGKRMCIISEGGGDCVVTADACIRANLTLSQFSTETVERLKEVIPPNGTTTNPIDLAGWENFVEATQIVLEDDEVDGVLLVGGFGGYAVIDPAENEKEIENVKKMVKLIKKAEKPVLIYSYFGNHDADGIRILQKEEIPIFFDHHDIVQTMKHLVTYDQYKKKNLAPNFDAISAGQKEMPFSLNQGELFVPEHLGKELLANYNLPYPKEALAHSESEALSIAKEIGYPVVLKIVSPQVVHKSDVGGVKVGISDPSSLSEAYNSILDNVHAFDKEAEIRGILVSKMVEEEGVEIIIGGVQDQTFGPVIMCGLGGIFVEVLKDVSFRVCPITKEDAYEMVHELQAFSLLTGARGKKPVDVESVVEALCNVSTLLVENSWIKELDLNPVLVHEKNLNVLDTRIAISK